MCRPRGLPDKFPASPEEPATLLKLPCRNIWEALGRVSHDDRESIPEAEKATTTPDPWGTPLGRLIKKYGPAAAVVLAVFIIGDRVWSIQTRHGRGYQATFEAGHMPVCDSGAVRQLLKKTLDESEAGAQGFKVLKLGDFVDISPRNADQPINPNPPTRRCMGEVFSNRGHLQVQADLSWTDADKDELYLDVVNVLGE